MKYIFIVIFYSSVFAQTFEQDALQYLQKQYPGYDKVEIQLQKNFASDEIITVDKSRNISISRGFAIVPVIATRGLKTSASIVSVKVTLYKKLFVAIRDFDRKESLKMKINRNCIVNQKPYRHSVPFPVANNLSYVSRILENPIEFKR